MRETRRECGVGRKGRRQRVVLAACQQERHGVDAERRAHLDELRRYLEATHIDHDARGRRDMAEVGDQPVTDVDHRGRAGPRGGRPRGVRRLRKPMGSDDYGRRPETPLRAASPAAAQPSRPANATTSPGRARPRDRRTPLQVAEGGDRDKKDIAATTSPPTTPASTRSHSSRSPSAKARPDATGVGGRGQPNEQRRGHRTHRGDVGEVLRGGLAADVVGRRPVAPEVPPVDEQIGRRDHSTVGRAHHRRVVTRPEQRVLPGR